MNEVASLDDGLLYVRMMRGASMVWEYEAAVRLVFRTRRLRQWMIERDFMVARELNGKPIVDVKLSEASDFLTESVLAGRREEGPGDSESNVLWVAASLSGVDVGPLRHILEDLETDHAKYVAEAVLYASGFTDSTVDPQGAEDEDSGTGPLGRAHDAGF